MDKYIDAGSEQFEAIKNFDTQGAFQMLNLLKFKDVLEETRRTGEKQY